MLISSGCRCTRNGKYADPGVFDSERFIRIPGETLWTALEDSLYSSIDTLYRG